MPSVLSNLGLKPLHADPLKARERPFLVVFGETTVADHVGGQDR